MCAVPRSSHPATGRCAARAALAGNPSDGHGGAVVAEIVDSLAATVTVRAAARFDLAGTTATFESLAEVDDFVRDPPAGTDRPLVAATLLTLSRRLRAEFDPVHISLETTIPRSVGLAGSSAIVIALMRALGVHFRDTGWSRRLASDPALVASLALVAERDVLGIPAGLQDRAVQAFGCPLAMEFGGDHRQPIAGMDAGTYRRLGPVPGSRLVAHRPDTAAASGSVHAAIDPADPTVREAMNQLAQQARRAALAIDDGDADRLGDAMDATFDLRASIMDLDPRHVEMITVARACGASANYTGSGGAVVVSAADDITRARAHNALLHDLGCVITALP